MKKIPCLFKRDYSKKERPIINEILKGSEWVINGEGIATKKYDGTCCLIENGIFYKRHTLRKNKIAPPDFTPATEINKITGKQEGWVLVKNIDKYHLEAYNRLIQASKFSNCQIKNGTYELCGPKVQGNPEHFQHHILIRHGFAELKYAPRDFNNLKKYLANNDMEGIVWHHPDGRMVKIKGIDFGINRKEHFKIKGMSADSIIIDDLIKGPEKAELKNYKKKIQKYWSKILLKNSPSNIHILSMRIKSNFINKIIDKQ